MPEIHIYVIMTALKHHCTLTFSYFPSVILNKFQMSIKKFYDNTVIIFKFTASLLSS